MSGSDRSYKDRDWIVLGFFASLVIALIAFAFIGSQYSYEALRQEYAASQAEAEARDNFKKECSGLSSVDKVILCFEKAIAGARDTQRSEEDLSAQRQMAAWAAGLLSLTFLQVALSGAGIYYVAATLRKTSEAVDVANRAIDDNRKLGEIQTRAYIRVISSTAGVRHEKTGIIHPFIKINVKNTGATPARNVLIYVGNAAFFESSVSLPLIGKNGVPGSRIPEMGSQDIELLDHELDWVHFPIDVIQARISSPSGEDVRYNCSIDGSIRFEDVFSFQRGVGFRCSFSVSVDITGKVRLNSRPTFDAWHFPD